MNIMILGSGGREHAISWKISQSEKCKNLYIAPGNAGTSLVGNNLLININDFEEVKLNVIEKHTGTVIKFDKTVSKLFQCKDHVSELR